MARILLTALTLLLACGFVRADTVKSAPGLGLQVVLQQPFSAPGPDILATSVVIEMPPGSPGSPPHFHSGPTLGYVIEGEFLFQVKGKPHRIIPAGEAFYELEREIHIWGGNASNSTTCKLLVTVIGRAHEDVNTFVKDLQQESREEALTLARQTLMSFTAPSAP